MSLLTAAQLQMMRDFIATALPDTAVISAAGTVRDAAGGFVESWTPVTDGTVACRIDPLGNQTRGMAAVEAGREQTIQMYQATFPYDAPLDAGLRVTINSDNYQVVQLDVKNTWRADKRAILTYVPGE